MKSSTSSVRYEWVLVSPAKVEFHLVAGRALAVEQAVADRDVQREVHLLTQALYPACAHRGEHQAEPRDRYRERVLVYAVDRVEGLADQLPLVGTWSLCFPGWQQLAERAQQEVAAAAGRVDHAQAGAAGPRGRAAGRA